MKRYIMTGLMCICVFCSLAQKQMMYGDTSRIGMPFSKDPHVVEFQGKYLMYYSIPPKQNGNAEAQGWGIGIAGSKNLKDGIVLEKSYLKQLMSLKGYVLRVLW